MNNANSANSVWKALTIGLVIILIAGMLGYGGYSFYVRSKETETANLKVAQQRKAVEDAINSLNKLHAGTEVGVNKVDYSRLLIESKALVNKANEGIQNGELKQALSLAIQGYSDASIIWDKGGTDKALLACAEKEELSKTDSTNQTQGSFDKFVRDMCNPEITMLAVKYNIPRSQVFNDMKLPGIIKNEALTIIWNASTAHTNRASELLREQEK